MLRDGNQTGFCQWILVITILFLGSSLASAEETEGGDTPEAVFKAAQIAGADKDFGALARLVAPSEHAMLAFGTNMAVGMFVEFYEGEKAAELKKKYEGFEKQYDVDMESDDDGEKLKITQETPQEEIDAHLLKRANRLFGHVDAVSYVPDLMGIVLELPEMAEETFFPQEELTGLEIDGDRAAGKAGEKEISFIREDGRWFLAADAME